MNILKALSLVFCRGLSILAANQSHILVPAVNITGANVDDYLIPDVNPPVILAFSHLIPDRITPIDASSVYMCAIENLAKICRHNPRGADFANPKIFSYGTATIRLESSEPRKQPYFTYSTACAVLRGLPEYMTLNRWWFESFVDVWVDGTMVGTAQLWNPDAENMVASIDALGTQITGGSIATT